MVRTTQRLEKRFKALMHPHRVRALDAFAEPRGRVASPSEIAHEIGIPVDALSYHVRELLKHGWIELVEKREGRKGGAIERRYRAVEHPQCDEETYAALAPAERRTLIDHTIGLMMADLVAASEAGTLHGRLDQHFSRTPVVVDDRGWDDLSARVMAIFREAEAIGGEAVNRVAGGEVPDARLIPARQCLFLFPSPPYDRYPRAHALSAGAWRSFPQVRPERGLVRTLKLLTHPSRVKAFSVLAASPGLVATRSEIAREIGSGVESVAYHMKILLESGWVETVGETGAEGDLAGGYRAVEIAACYDSPAWGLLTDGEQRFVIEQILGLVLTDFAASADAGTLETKPNFHLSRNLLMLDRSGWDELAGRMTALVHHAQTLTATSAALVASGELSASELFTARVGMFLFEPAPRIHGQKNSPS